MKKILLLTLLALFMPMAVSAYDYDAYIDGIYYRFSGKEAAVTCRYRWPDDNSSAYKGSVVIPESVTHGGKTYQVTSISKYAFCDCNGLTSITIPKSITSINDRSFDGCTSLTAVHISDLEAWCKTSISYYSSNPLYFAKHLFLNDQEIKELTIPNSITKIKDYAFSGCSGLTSVTIPNSVNTIGRYAFYNCNGLTSVTIPNSITSIEYDAFRGCDGLTAVNISDLESWCKISFKDNSLCYAHHLYMNGSEITNLVIPNSVTSIGSYTFVGCSSLTSVSIPESVTSIGNGAFSGCSGLTSITIPSSITKISYYPFDDCANLKTVIIESAFSHEENFERYDQVSYPPENPFYFHVFGNQVEHYVLGTKVYKILSNAFDHCDKMETLTVLGNITGIDDNSFECCNNLKTIELNCKRIGSHFNKLPFSTISNIVLGDNTESIDEKAFYCFNRLTTITIPKNMKSIGRNAFYGCNNMTSVTLESNDIVSASRTEDTSLKTIFGEQVKKYVIGDSVRSIGNYVFYGCSNLTSVIIGSQVANIGLEAFSDCIGLTSITIPNCITTIDKKAFANCSGLTLVSIPKSVTTIDSYAFSGCTGLTKVINADVVSWCNIKFADYTSNPLYYAKHLYSNESIEIKKLIIPDDVTSISDYAFYNCSGLTSVSIPKSMTRIGSYAFFGCTGLTKVINADVASWCKIIFDNSTSNPIYFAKHLYSNESTEIKELVIPNNITSISNYAFYNCSGLNSISIPLSVKTVGSSAFEGCTNITSLDIDCKDVSNWFSGNKQLRSLILGEHVQSIGSYAFSGCSSLTSLSIPEAVTSIGSSAFAGCSGLTSITIPDKMRTINGNTFQNCSALTSVTIPNNLTLIGIDAFKNCDNAKFFVNKGTNGLLSLWKYGKDPYEIGTTHQLSRPIVSVTSTTQTTIKYFINNIYPELTYEKEGDALTENEYLITGLKPDYSKTINLIVNSANNSYSTSVDATTQPISPTINEKGIKASSISVKGSYIEGDANIVSQCLIINGEETEGGEGALCGLDPNSVCNCIYQVVVEDDMGDKHLYQTSKEVSTADLVLVTQQPKVISEGNIIVTAKSNLDDNETNVGFEWRRIDWTDDFDSRTGGAYLYDGMMEGYIRSINSNYLWKFRPYYTSNAGNTYYGEWKGMDPSDYSYFEPTVHTYATISVTGNRAEVKGYAMRGTDKVKSQGFKYWKNMSSYSPGQNVTSVPSDAITIEVNGNVMIATLEDLDYEIEYCYVAFVTTEENETFYGELQIFSTHIDPDGIGEVESSKLEVESLIFDINGRKLSALQKGINIIRYSDGTNKKVLVK